MSFPSPSPLSEASKADIAKLLQPVVLALWGLAGIARKAHLNVKGMAFGPLHELFGELYDACNAQGDKLGEHVTLVLGIPIEGDHVDVAEGSGLTRMPSSVTACRDLARAVGDRVTQVLVVVNTPKRDLVSLGDEDAQQKCIDASMALSDISGKILAHIG